MKVLGFVNSGALIQVLRHSRLSGVNTAVAYVSATFLDAHESAGHGGTSQKTASSTVTWYDRPDDVRNHLTVDIPLTFLIFAYESASHLLN